MISNLWKPIANIQSDIVANGLLPLIVMQTALILNAIPYILIHLFFEDHVIQYKIHKNKKLTRTEFLRKLKLIGRDILISLLAIPVLNYFMFRYSERSIEKLPSIFTVVWQIGFIILGEETLFYWVHRFMHVVPYLMQKFHQHHHQEQYTDFLSTRMFDSVDDFFGNFLPVLLPAAFLSHVTELHLFTLFIWYFIMMYETITQHSGYAFPFHLFDSRVHAFHHSHYRDNYGSFFGIWDRLLGTDSAYHAYLKKKQLKNK
jgi:4-alpha-methyl-delta7-sterol-4alpha-methyl oxidase